MKQPQDFRPDDFRDVENKIVEINTALNSLLRRVNRDDRFISGLISGLPRELSEQLPTQAFDATGRYVPLRLNNLYFHEGVYQWNMAFDTKVAAYDNDILKETLSTPIICLEYHIAPRIELEDLKIGDELQLILANETEMLWTEKRINPNVEFYIMLPVLGREIFTHDIKKAIETVESLPELILEHYTKPTIKVRHRV